MEDDAYSQLEQLVRAGETGVIFDMLTNSQKQGLADDWNETCIPEKIIVIHPTGEKS